MRLALAAVSATLLLALAACGGGENDSQTPTGVTVTDPEGDVCTVDVTPDGAGFDCPNGERMTGDTYTGPVEGGEAPPGRDTDDQWSVGEKRIIEYESWWGEGTGEIAQVEVKLLGVDVRREQCAGPKNPVAVRLKLRVENVGPTVAEVPQLNGYWLSADGRRVDDPGCMSDQVPTLKPGEWAVGVEREQVPVESGSLVVETAYPFVDSLIPLPASSSR